MSLAAAFVPIWVLTALGYAACRWGLLGEAAALATVEQRKGKDFISIEEFSTTCNKLSKTHIEQLKALGAFAGMAETSQVSFF